MSTVPFNGSICLWFRAVIQGERAASENGDKSHTPHNPTYSSTSLTNDLCNPSKEQGVGFHLSAWKTVDIVNKEREPRFICSVSGILGREG